MEKVRETSVKTSPIPLLNFGKLPKQPMHARGFWKEVILKETM